MASSGADSGDTEEQENAPDDTYVVQRGDTLTGVALRFGVKQSELKRANHMYGSRTLVAGQVLKLAAPPKSTKDLAVPPTAAPSDPQRQSPPVEYQNSRSVSEAGAAAAAIGARDGDGGTFAVTLTAAMAPTETPLQAAAAAAAAAAAGNVSGVLPEPPEEEIWFEDRGQQEDGSAAAAAAAKTASSSTIGTTAPLSSLAHPFEETKWSSATASATTPELLYEPLNWGGGGTHSRQVSDASSSASAAAAAAGASVRGMFNYIRAKAAAVTTPTAAAAAAAAAAGFAFDSGGGGGSFSSAYHGDVENDDFRQPSAAGTAESNLNGGSSGDGGESSEIVDGCGFLGSPLPMPGEPGEPTVDESLPPVELWSGERKDGVTAQAVACAVAQEAAREVSEAAQRDAGERPSESLLRADSKSKTETLLSMVKPSYWRGSEEAGSEGGRTGTGSDLPFGYGGGGRASEGWVVEDSDRGVRVPSFGAPRDADGVPVAESIRRTSDPSSEEAADVTGFVLGDLGMDSAPPAPQTVPLKLPGLVCGGSMIVTHLALARMEAALPKHHRGYNWHLLFSTLRDGASYTTLYNRIKAEEPTFVIVESMRGEVFGGFATSAWASGCQYYGTGECFLFKLENGERVAVDTGGDADSDGGRDAGSPGATVKHLMDGEIATYEWTGMNMYLQYSDGAGMGLGGGGMAGSFGLYIGEDFLSGSTGKCDTYGNPPLCSQEQFQVSQVEIWGFTTADTEMGARLERLRKTLRGKTTRPL